MAPADQDPDPSDELVQKIAPSDHGIRLGKHTEHAGKNVSQDMMGNVNDRDASARAAEAWLAENEKKDEKRDISESPMN